MPQLAGANTCRAISISEIIIHFVPISRGTCCFDDWIGIRWLTQWLGGRSVSFTWGECSENSLEGMDVVPSQWKCNCQLWLISLYIYLSLSICLPIYSNLSFRSSWFLTILASVLGEWHVSSSQSFPQWRQHLTVHKLISPTAGSTRLNTPGATCSTMNRTHRFVILFQHVCNHNELEEIHNPLHINKE